MTQTSNELRAHLFWLALGWALIGLVLYLSLTSTPPDVMDFRGVDKVEHLLAYGTLMGWFGQVYPSLRAQAGWALGFCALGIFLEFLQGWGGYRTFDTHDMLADAIGVGVGWWLTRHWFAGILPRLDRAFFR